jgi:hypothetical protein
MEDCVGLIAVDFPMRHDVRVLADQRQPLVGMRGELKKQQRK